MKSIYPALILFSVFISPVWGQESNLNPEIPKRIISATDARGNPLTDPSENVKAVLEAGMKALADVFNRETKRQDDLRAVKDQLFQAELKRVDEVAAVIQKYENRISDITRDYSIKTLDAESKRIDANRASDAAANKEASTLALSSIKEITAQALASSKEAISKQEGSTDKRFDQLKSELGVQFKGMDEKLVLLTTQYNLSAGRDAGTSTLYGVFGVIIGLLIGAGTLLLNFRRTQPHPMPASVSDPVLMALITKLVDDKVSK